MMEKQGLVTREQRVGIWTTTKGSALLPAEIDRYYEGIAGEILGRDLLNALRKRVVSYNYLDDNTCYAEKSD